MQPPLDLFDWRRTADDTCPNGAAYRVSTTGETIVVKRSGVGESVFSPGGAPQAGMALDLVTQTGERGAIFGPMRSYMFVPIRKRYQGRLPDPGGFYRVISDDAQMSCSRCHMSAASTDSLAPASVNARGPGAA